MIVPVILSGGSGTRMWPVSTAARPKQFLPLVTDKTMFQETLLRLQGLPGLAEPIIVCNEEHRFLVAEQLRETGIEPRAIVLEPEGRNTAPAIAIAALLCQIPSPSQSQAQSDAPSSADGDCLLVLPADHVIADGRRFREAVATAVEVARAGKLVTFGIVPTHAETGYGYIEQGERQGDWSLVSRFVEKPDADTAQAYLDSGRFLWNSGMFLFDVQMLLDEMRRVASPIVAACETAVGELSNDDVFSRLGPAFLKCESDSIDYALMEKTDKAAVVPLSVGWNDVGSWSALHEVHAHDANGNVVRGNVLSEACSNCYIEANSRLVAAIGLEDIVVVETDGAVLVVHKSQSQLIKKIAQAASQQSASRDNNQT